MHLVQDHHIGMQAVQFLRLKHGQLGVGHEGNVSRHPCAGGGKALALGFEDVLRRREPQYGLLRVILTVFEADEAFACTGRMDDAGSAFGFQRLKQRVVGLLVMWEKRYGHVHFSPFRWLCLNTFVSIPFEEC